MINEREYHIINGSKKHFDDYVNNSYNDVISFIELVRLSDERRNRGLSFEDDEKANFLIVKNDHYHGIVPSAHDRLGSLIEELTLDDSTIYVHNPPIKLIKHLKNLYSRNEIKLIFDQEKYEINQTPDKFSNSMSLISEKVIGQYDAIHGVSKSLWYLTTVNRRKPYVIMLYGDSSLGKSELVREISNNFYDSKFVEKHLSMFKNDSYSYYFFGNQPNRTSLGFDLLERESNLVFLDELDKCPEYFYSSFYTLFDNEIFQDATYDVDISGLVIILTSNYNDISEMKRKLGLPIFYRINKFIHFNTFSKETIYKITMNEIQYHVNESNGVLDESKIYNKVSPQIDLKNENARTIKNKVQEVVEELLFEKVKK